MLHHVANQKYNSTEHITLKTVMYVLYLPEQNLHNILHYNSQPTYRPKHKNASMNA